MDPLRSNVPDYYAPQQYTPIPLPTYPPPTFGTPSPYAGHHLQNQNHHPAIQYNPTRHLGQAQLVAPAPAPAQAPVQAPVQAPIPTPVPAPRSTPVRTPQQNTRAGVRNLDAEGNDGTPATGERPMPGPKGFGRTSAIYRLDESGKKRRAQAEDFRAEVEERTRNGESCEQIADALIAQGAQVTAKSVGRWRILWGFRKRVCTTLVVSSYRQIFECTNFGVYRLSGSNQSHQSRKTNASVPRKYGSPDSRPTLLA